jgi:glycerol-3-phosphate dehydrogenase
MIAGAAARQGVDEAVLTHLVGRYGGETPEVIELSRTGDDLAGPLVPGLPYLRAEAVYAVRSEMARTLADVLSRRTRALLRARDATAEAADDVARLIAPDLGWDENQMATEAADFRRLAQRERESGHLPETALPGSPS